MVVRTLENGRYPDCITLQRVVLAGSRRCQGRKHGLELAITSQSRNGAHRVRRGGIAVPEPVQ